MKNHLILFSFFIGLVLIACGNQSNAPGPGVSGASRNENEVDLLIGANYYEEAKDDQGNSSYKYGAWLTTGNSVLVLPGEVKTVKVPDSKGNLGDDMIRPARLADGKNVFISTYYILPKQRLGVIVAAEKASVYDGLKPANITVKTLPRLTLVGVAPVDEKDNPLKRQRFVVYKAAQNDGKAFSAGVWTPFYLDAADVSTAVSDIEMAKIIANLPNKDKSLWGKIINDAEKLYPDSVLLADAKALIGQGSEPAPKAVETVSLHGVVNDANVNVRSEPDENGGSVIGQLQKDAAVDITAETVESYTVGGVTARWFKIKTETLEGWMFGGYLAVE